MKVLKLGGLAVDELIELAAERDLIDAAEYVDGRYRVDIGAATFMLDEDGTREFLLRLIRNHSVDVE